MTADKDYTIKTVKIDGEEVELDKNGQYTISRSRVCINSRLKPKRLLTLP